MAQLSFGVCYAAGRGVAKDMQQAVSWFRRAAEQGDAQALFFMGLCCARGEGVAKDEIESYAYWNLAGLKLESARENLAMLEKKISSDARLLGQQRTKQLEKEIGGCLNSNEQRRKSLEHNRLRKCA